MRVVIIALVFVAVILAGGTAYLLRGYLSSQQAEIAAQKPVAPTVKVLVAASDMPVGTVVNENNTTWVEWPEGNVPEGFLARTDSSNPLTEIGKEKHLARRGFAKGEPITMERLYKSETPGFLRGTLEPGMRAVAVRSSPEVGASGFILPGDRVDLVLTHDMLQELTKGQGAPQDMPKNMNALLHTSETIIEDLRVLAVDQKTNEFEGGAALSKTILLEVTAKQAEIINTAKVMGSLSLSLRSAEPGDPRTDTLFTTDVEVSPMLSAISSGKGKSTASTAAPAPVYRAPAAPKTKSAITVYRGVQPGAAQ
ncbi:MAG TPA: Flp pilus assembly protein CpaB [Magnetovibrio sp.]